MGKPRVKPGSRVVLSKGFLRRIGARGDHGDELARLKGTLIELRVVGGHVVARVRWDGEQEPQSILPCNLAKTDTDSRFNQD